MRAGSLALLSAALAAGVVVSARHKSRIDSTLRRLRSALESQGDELRRLEVAHARLARALADDSANTAALAERLWDEEKKLAARSAADPRPVSAAELDDVVDAVNDIVDVVDELSGEIEANRGPPSTTERDVVIAGAERRLIRHWLGDEGDAGRSLTTLRRVSIDLTGLPPPVETIQEMLGDSAEGLLEKAVERLATEIEAEVREELEASLLDASRRAGEAANAGRGEAETPE